MSLDIDLIKEELKKLDLGYVEFLMNKHENDREAFQKELAETYPVFADNSALVVLEVHIATYAAEVILRESLKRLLAMKLGDVEKDVDMLKHIISCIERLDLSYVDILIEQEGKNVRDVKQLIKKIKPAVLDAFVKDIEEDGTAHRETVLKEYPIFNTGMAGLLLHYEVTLLLAKGLLEEKK